MGWIGFLQVDDQEKRVVDEFLFIKLGLFLSGFTTTFTCNRGFRVEVEVGVVPSGRNTGGRHAEATR
jgi:hypothetical protein